MFFFGFERHNKSVNESALGYTSTLGSRSSKTEFINFRSAVSIKTARLSEVSSDYVTSTLPRYHITSQHRSEDYIQGCESKVRFHLSEKISLCATIVRVCVRDEEPSFPSSTVEVRRSVEDYSLQSGGNRTNKGATSVIGKVSHQIG